MGGLVCGSAVTSPMRENKQGSEIRRKKASLRSSVFSASILKLPWALRSGAAARWAFGSRCTICMRLCSLARRAFGRGIDNSNGKAARRGRKQSYRASRAYREARGEGSSALHRELFWLDDGVCICTLAGSSSYQLEHDTGRDAVEM